MASRMPHNTSLETSAISSSEVVSSLVDSYKNKNGYSIVLDNERVVMLREQKEVGSSVLLEDILGVQITQKQGDGVKLVVHGFPKTKKIFRSEARSLMKLVMHFDSDNASEEWKKKIILQSRKVIQEKYGWYQGESEILSYVCMRGPPLRAPLLATVAGNVEIYFRNVNI